MQWFRISPSISGEASSVRVTSGISLPLSVYLSVCLSCCLEVAWVHDAIGVELTELRFIDICALQADLWRPRPRAETALD